SACARPGRWRMRDRPPRHRPGSAPRPPQAPPSASPALRSSEHQIADDRPAAIGTLLPDREIRTVAGGPFAGLVHGDRPAVAPFVYQAVARQGHAVVVDAAAQHLAE